jgi:hypothetical protein
MLDETGAGSLKLIVGSDDPATERTLRDHVGDAELRRAGVAAWLAYTDASAAEIRDWLAGDDSGLIVVVEFERWSAYGEIDTEWLLRRGH